MKVACPLCGEMLPRKRMVPIAGMTVKREGRRKAPRVCPECFALPDDEHKRSGEEKK